MNKVIVYIHGKGGNAGESDHYIPLFPNYTILGFDYTAETPWEAREEFTRYFAELEKQYDSTSVIANSIGAFFFMNAEYRNNIEHVFFISPVVDMEQLIRNMMTWANVTEEELRAKGEITTAFGETLSADYLDYVITHPVSLSVPANIIYGRNDHLVSLETISAFAKKTSSSLTIMENGEHWFHTPEQMRFLDAWILNKK